MPSSYLGQDGLVGSRGSRLGPHDHLGPSRLGPTPAGNEGAGERTICVFSFQDLGQTTEGTTEGTAGSFLNRKRHEPEPDLFLNPFLIFEPDEGFLN